MDLTQEERELLVHLLEMYQAQSERGLKYDAGFTRQFWLKRAPILDSIITKLKREQS